MAADLTSLDAVLKETWPRDRLEEQIYQDNPFLDEIEKTDRYKVGAQAVVPLHVGRNAGYTALPAAGGTLNTAGQQDLAQATYNYTHHNQQIAVQGSALDGTDGNSLAVVNALDVEVEGGLNDLKKQLTRQAFMNGTGAISGVLTDAGADDTIDLNAIDGFNAIERGWLYVGAVVDVGSTADTDGTADGIAVIAVTESTTVPTIQLASGTYTTTAGTEFVYWHEACGGGAQTASREMNGLANLVAPASTAFGGITASAEPTWNSDVDSTAQALTLDLMLARQRKVRQKTGNMPDYVLTSLKQEENFYKQLQLQVRFDGERNLGAGKVAGPTWNGMSINAHPDCKNEQMYFLTKKHIFIVATDKPHWQNKHTGGKTLDWIQGTDSYGAKLTYRINLATDRRNAHSALTGLT